MIVRDEAVIGIPEDSHYIDVSVSKIGGVFIKMLWREKIPFQGDKLCTWVGLGVLKVRAHFWIDVGVFVAAWSEFSFTGTNGFSLLTFRDPIGLVSGIF